MSELQIKNTGELKKFRETHFEKFIRVAKKAVGKSPLHYVEVILKELKGMTGYEPTATDDYHYQEAALMFFNERAKSVGYNKELALKDLYEGDPAILNEYRSVLNMLHHTHRFSRTRMIFRFEEALTAKLIHTDLSKVDSHFLTSPFDSLYIDLPHNTELLIPNQQTGIHTVEGIYVSYGHDIDVKGVNLPDGSSLDVDGVHPDLKFQGAPATKILRIMAIAGGNENSVDELDDANFYMTFFLAPGDVFEQMEITMSKYTSEGPEDQQTYMRKLFAFTLNSLLYITNPSADLKKVGAKFHKDSRNKKKADKKNEGLSKIPVVSTGSSLKISNTFREQYRNGSLRNLTINVPLWMVRGHWRNQAYGEARSLRRLQWIEPYEKGRGVDTESVGRDYNVT